ncbi:Mitochondrial inner membrane magnesium transporter [Erysiphe necator]|nr:Mitochondrial inner membrane magnesium transporter [Erysiphe necator]
MRSVLSPPSLLLLRFLKAQSEGVGFLCSINGKTEFTKDKQEIPKLYHAPSHFKNTKINHVSSNKVRLSSPNYLATIPAACKFSAHNHVPDPKRLFSGSPNLVTQRKISDGSRTWIFTKLWGKNKVFKNDNPIRIDNLYQSRTEENHDSSMFSLGRYISAKAATQPILRCTEIDEKGNVVLASGEFKKSELIAKYGLLPRDLRKIDSSLLPHILVRPSAILINLLHLRVLIKSNRVLVFDAYGTTDTYNQSAFIYDLENKLRHKQSSVSAGGLPYEFRALESVLISVITSLETEFEGVRAPVVRVLRDLEEDIDRDKLRLLLILSKKLGTFEQKAKLVRNAIDELLEADDDLAAMYLTEKSQNLVRGDDDHTEVEMLLESYHKLCDEIVQESGNLISNIRNTEEIVKAILDANRNSLMLLDLKFSIGTLGIGSGAFIAALFGMNLKNYLEDSNLGFLGVTGWTLIFSGIICTYGLSKLRGVQRLTMWGEGGRRGRSWRDEENRALLNRETKSLKRLERQRCTRDRRISGEAVK